MGQESRHRKDEMFHGQYCRVKWKFPAAVLKAALDYKRGIVNATKLGRLREILDAVPYIPVAAHDMSHYLGFCLPSMCSHEDISRLISSIPLPGSASLEKCDSKTDVDVDFEQRVVLAVFIFLGVMVSIGTIVDKFLQFYPKEGQALGTKKKGVSVVVAFSICSNTKNLFRRIENKQIDSPNWKVIRGLVVGSVFCIIICHTYLPPFSCAYLQASNLANLQDYLSQPYFALIVCLPITIETLFISQGFVLTYRVWKSTWKDGNKKIAILKTILHSYLRLILPLLFCIGIIVLLPLFGSGPLWEITFGAKLKNCKQSWWENLGMYNNVLDIEDQCFPNFWFVPCALQITIVSTILLLILSRCPKTGVFLTLCTVVGCAIAVALSTLSNNLPPSNVAYFAERESDLAWKINYSLPFNHAGSFALGMILGIVMARKSQMNIRLVFRVAGWLLSLVSIFGICMLMLYSYRGNTAMSPSWAAVYAASHRTIFSTAVSWIFLACAYGYGGCMGYLLSWSVLDPLYKLSFFAYLLHPIVIGYHLGNARTHSNYSHMDLMLRSLSYICVSYGGAYICSMIVDMPLRALQFALCKPKFLRVNITSVIPHGEISSSSKSSEQSYVNIWHSNVPEK